MSTYTTDLKPLGGLFTPIELRLLEHYFSISQEEAEKCGYGTFRAEFAELGFLEENYRHLDLTHVVAAILLENAQNRLLNWCCWNSKGELVFGRTRRPLNRLREFLLAPRLLFSINWASTGPGLWWPVDYCLTWVPGFNRFVVTESRDDNVTGYTDKVHGHFQSPRTYDEEEVGKIFRAHWDDVSEGGRWANFLQAGLVGEATALDWAEEVWFFEVDHDDAEEGWVEHPDGGYYYQIRMEELVS